METRYAHHPDHVKTFSTDELRNYFLIEPYSNPIKSI